MNQNHNHIGETNVANNGQKMTIIKYRNSNDIDVQFDDGNIIYHQKYIHFKKGYIYNKNHYKTIRVGETKMMDCGMKATIIDYHNSHNVDIKFEDGTILKNKTYSQFNNGTLKNVTHNCIGESVITSNGQKATIIEYHNAYDIDVKFEDGTIVQHKTYGDFKKGHIKNPDYLKLKYVGQTNTASNGMQMTIINYRKGNDIDIQFEDGTIVTHKAIHNFLKGFIHHPDEQTGPTIADRLGETKIMNCGARATIIEYRKYNDIDIQFDDGTKKEHTTYSAFKLGRIKHPDSKLYPSDNTYIDRKSLLQIVNIALAVYNRAHTKNADTTLYEILHPEKSMVINHLPLNFKGKGKQMLLAYKDSSDKNNFLNTFEILTNKKFKEFVIKSIQDSKS